MWSNCVSPGGLASCVVSSGEQIVGVLLVIDRAEKADSAADALAALNEDDALAPLQRCDSGSEPGNTGADDHHICSKLAVGRGAEPCGGGAASNTEALVERASGTNDEVAQEAAQAIGRKRVSALAASDVVDAIERRGTLHWQLAPVAGRAAGKDDLRGKGLGQRQRDITMPAGNLDARGECGREHRIASKPVHRAPVEAEAERLAAVELSAAKSVWGVGGDAIGAHGMAA